MTVTTTTRFPAQMLAAVLTVGLLAAPAFAGQTPAAAEPFEGYVVSLDDAKLTASNVPVMPQGQAMQGGGKQMAIRLGDADKVLAEQGLEMVTNADGTISVKRKDGAEGEAAEGGASAEQPRRVMIQAGDGTNAAEEGAEGRTMTWTSDAAAAAVPASDEPLQFSDFVITADTERPDNLMPGMKIRVHFEEHDGQKMATQIEVVETS